MKPLASNRASGFSLIEILVAVLVLTLGLLGVAALQINAMKNNQSALQRSRATMLAYFMLDAMRANRAEAEAGSYNLGSLGTPDSPVCTAPSGSTLVATDHAAWFTALKDQLGDQSSTCGLVSCSAASCTVKVFWDDSRGTAGSSTQTIEITSRL